VQQVLKELEQFSTVDLETLLSYALLDRWDTKFLLPIERMPDFINALHFEYKLLKINNYKISSYSNDYLDTSDFHLFHQHRNGKLPRYKIRYRHYLQSQLTFLEIKKKITNGKTIKERWELPFRETNVHDRYLNSTNFPVASPRDLQQTLTNSFQRIALVSPALRERVSIDFDLRFSQETHEVSMPSHAVIEVKQLQLNEHSIVFKQLRSWNITPTQFSKYCIGTCLLNPNVPASVFSIALKQIKPTILQPI
jgi:hypothetical protein